MSNTINRTLLFSGNRIEAFVNNNNHNINDNPHTFLYYI